VALVRKETCNLRHPMHLRHPVATWFNNITYILDIYFVRGTFSRVGNFVCICAFVLYLCICAFVTICAHSLRPAHGQYIPTTYASVICAFLLLFMCGPQRVSANSDICVCSFVSVYLDVCVYVSMCGPQRVSANSNLISYTLVRDT